MLTKLKYLFRSTFREWKKNNPLFLGAGISFYIILAMGPLLVVLIFLTSMLVEGYSTERQLIQQIQNSAGEKAAALIQNVLEQAKSGSGRTITIIASIPLIFFGSTMVFFQLRYALNIIFGTEENSGGSFKDSIKKYSFSFLMLLVLGAVLLLLTLKNPILSVLKENIRDILPLPWLVFRILEVLFSFSLIVFVFFMVYYLLPDKKMNKKNIFTGAVVTAFLFIIVQYLVGINAKNSQIDSAYGAIGSATILLLWIFYSSLVFLFGASFTKVIARKSG